MFTSLCSALLILFLASFIGHICKAEELASNLCTQKPYLVFCRSNPPHPDNGLLENDKAVEFLEITTVESNDTYEEMPASVSKVVPHAKNEDMDGIDARSRKHHPLQQTGEECDRLGKRFLRSVPDEKNSQARLKDYVDYEGEDPEYYEYRARRARLLKRLKALDAEASSNAHSIGNFYNTKQSHQSPYQHQQQYQSSYYGDCSPYYQYYGQSSGDLSGYYPTTYSNYYPSHSNTYYGSGGYGAGNYYGGGYGSGYGSGYGGGYGFPYGASGAPGQYFNMDLGSGLNIGLPYGLGVGVNYGLGINVG